jgi:putative endonuclease
MRWRNFDPRRWKRVAQEEVSSTADASVEVAAGQPPQQEHRVAREFPAPHLALGRRGEALAAQHLEGAGYRLVAANFTLPVGRNLRGALLHAELDIIAYDGATLCFIEVKTRASDWFAPPEANVDLRKQRQVARAARAYRRLFNLTSAPYRYDVVSVIVPHEQERSAHNESPPSRLIVLRNFWTDDKFRKRRWSDAPYDF